MAFGQNYDENIKKLGGEGGIWLKVSEEKASRIALLGEEVIGFGRWDGKAVVPAKDGEKDATPRMATNVWDFDTDSVKILNTYKAVYQDLKELDNDLSGDICNYIVGIKKNGKKTDIRGIRPLTAEEKEKIKSAVLFDLDKSVSWRLGNFGDDNVPF